MREIKIGGLLLDMEELHSRGELMEYFDEHGPTYSALVDFCEGYLEKYGNELCWHYPVSDGKHLGTFLVLVREGILSLPYDDADKADCELFCTDEVAMFQDSSDMDIFLDDWDSFQADLVQAMTAMRDYLRGQEVAGHGED